MLRLKLAAVAILVLLLGLLGECSSGRLSGLPVATIGSPRAVTFGRLDQPPKHECSGQRRRRRRRRHSDNPGEITNTIDSYPSQPLPNQVPGLLSFSEVPSLRQHRISVEDTWRESSKVSQKNSHLQELLHSQPSFLWVMTQHAAEPFARAWHEAWLAHRPLWTHDVARRRVVWQLKWRYWRGEQERLVRQRYDDALSRWQDEARRSDQLDKLSFRAKIFWGKTTIRAAAMQGWLKKAPGRACIWGQQQCSDFPRWAREDFPPLTRRALVLATVELPRWCVEELPLLPDKVWAACVALSWPVRLWFAAVWRYDDRAGSARRWNWCVAQGERAAQWSVATVTEACAAAEAGARAVRSPQPLPTYSDAAVVDSTTSGAAASSATASGEGKGRLRRRRRRRRCVESTIEAAVDETAAVTDGQRPLSEATSACVSWVTETWDVARAATVGAQCGSQVVARRTQVATAALAVEALEACRAATARGPETVVLLSAWCLAVTAEVTEAVSDGCAAANAWVLQQPLGAFLSQHLGGLGQGGASKRHRKSSGGGDDDDDDDAGAAEVRERTTQAVQKVLALCSQTPGSVPASDIVHADAKAESIEAGGESDPMLQADHRRSSGPTRNSDSEEGNSDRVEAAAISNAASASAEAAGAAAAAVEAAHAAAAATAAAAAAHEEANGWVLVNEAHGVTVRRKHLSLADLGHTQLPPNMQRVRDAANGIVRSPTTTTTTIATAATASSGTSSSGTTGTSTTSSSSSTSSSTSSSSSSSNSNHSPAAVVAAAAEARLLRETEVAVVKARAIVQCSAESLFELLKDNARVHEYNDNCRLVMDLQHLSKDTKITYANSPRFGPFKPRDFCTLVHFERVPSSSQLPSARSHVAPASTTAHSHETPSRRSSGHGRAGGSPSPPSSSSSTLVVVNLPADHPSAAPNSDHVRSEVLLAGYVLRPLGPYVTELTTVTAIDAGGGVANSAAGAGIVNKLAATTPVFFIRRLEAAAAKDDLVHQAAAAKGAPKASSLNSSPGRGFSSSSSSSPADRWLTAMRDQAGSFTDAVDTFKLQIAERSRWRSSRSSSSGSSSSGSSSSSIPSSTFNSQKSPIGRSSSGCGSSLESSFSSGIEVDSQRGGSRGSGTAATAGQSQAPTTDPSTPAARSRSVS